MFRKQRRCRLLVVALVLTTTAIGCGSTGSSDVKQDAKAPLEVWIRQDPNTPAAKIAKQLSDAFTKRTGIKTTMVAQGADFENKLAQAAARKDLPDLVINDTAQLGTLVSQGEVIEVDRSKLNDAGQISKRAWGAARDANGKYYAVPFSAQSFALLIRSDWRHKVGLPAPKTWNDLVRLAKAFTKQDPDGDGKNDTYGLDVPGTTARGYLSWYFSNYLWEGGGDYFTGKVGSYRPAVNSPASVAAVSWLQGLFCTEKVVQPGAVTMDTVTTHQVFESGKAGIYLTGPYMLSRFDRSLGKDKYEVVELPNGPGGHGGLAEGENVYLMAGSANRAGQLKFAEFASSTEGQKIGMAPDGGDPIVRLPINTTTDMDNIRHDKRWDIFAKTYAEYARYVPTVPNWTPFLQASAEALNTLAANCSSKPKPEMDKLARTFDELLAKQKAKG